MAMERDLPSEHGETGLRPDSHLPEREESGGGGREGEENKEAARVRIRMDLEGLITHRGGVTHRSAYASSIHFLSLLNLLFI